MNLPEKYEKLEKPIYLPRLPRPSCLCPAECCCLNYDNYISCNVASLKDKLLPLVSLEHSQMLLDLSKNH